MNSGSVSGSFSIAMPLTHSWPVAPQAKQPRFGSAHAPKISSTAVTLVPKPGAPIQVRPLALPCRFPEAENARLRIPALDVSNVDRRIFTRVPHLQAPRAL